MKRYRIIINLCTSCFLCVVTGSVFSQTLPKPAKTPAAPPTAPVVAPAKNTSKAPPSSPADKSKPPAATDALSVDEARLADRFKRLEEVIGRLAELSASSDPRRAKLLREAIAQSREQDLNVRFES